MASIMFKVEKTGYDASVKRMQEADLRSRMEFLEGVFVFSAWSETELRKIAYVMSPKRYEKNACIIRQGETCAQRTSSPKAAWSQLTDQERLTQG